MEIIKKLKGDIYEKKNYEIRESGARILETEVLATFLYGCKL